MTRSVAGNLSPNSMGSLFYKSLVVSFLEHYRTTHKVLALRQLHGHAAKRHWPIHFHVKWDWIPVRYTHVHLCLPPWTAMPSSVPFHIKVCGGRSCVYTVATLRSDTKTTECLLVWSPSLHQLWPKWISCVWTGVDLEWSNVDLSMEAGWPAHHSLFFLGWKF